MNGNVRVAINTTCLNTNARAKKDSFVRVIWYIVRVLWFLVVDDTYGEMVFMKEPVNYMMAICNISHAHLICDIRISQSRCDKEYPLLHKRGFPVCDSLVWNSVYKV